MNKNKIALISGISIVCISLITIGTMLYRPVRICNKILPYTDSNYCFAITTKLPKVRKQYKLKYSLIDRKNLEQIFVNIRNFQSNTENSRIDEFTSPEVIGDITKRNNKIDDIVNDFISYYQNLLVEAENETRYHSRNKYSGIWINYEHVFGESISAANEAEIKEILKKAEDEGKFPPYIATRLRQFRALGTPYCEIDSLGTITDCDGNYLGVVSNVFKPLGKSNSSQSSSINTKNNKNVKNESEILKKAILQYKKDHEIYGDPQVDYEDNMPINEPVYSNSGMPKSLAIEGIPIICFEWANMGDTSKCSAEQINTIEKFFKENTDIDWGSEYFDYEITN